MVKRMELASDTGILVSYFLASISGLQTTTPTLALVSPIFTLMSGVTLKGSIIKPEDPSVNTKID